MHYLKSWKYTLSIPLHLQKSIWMQKPKQTTLLWMITRRLRNSDKKTEKEQITERKKKMHGLIDMLSYVYIHVLYLRSQHWYTETPSSLSLPYSANTRSQLSPTTLNYSASFFPLALKPFGLHSKQRWWKLYLRFLSTWFFLIGGWCEIGERD